MVNMKKRISILLAIVILITSLIIPVTANETGSSSDGAFISTGDKLYPVTMGDTYTYEYRLNLGKKLTALDAYLSYDTVGLELVNYSFPILGSSANAGTYGGKLYFNYSSASGTSFSSDTSVLIRATFKVKSASGTFDVHTDITDMARYQEVKIVENGAVLSNYTYRELITDDDSKTSIYIETGNKYYKVKRGKTYNYICYLKTGELVGNLAANTYYDSYGLSTSSSTRTTYQSYSGKSFAADDTVLVSIPFTVSNYADDNCTYYIYTNISKLQDINEDTIYNYMITEVIEGLSYVTHDPNEPPTEPEPTEAPIEPTEPATEAPWWWDATEPVPSPTEGGNQRPINYRPSDSYTVDSYTPYTEEAITECGGSLSNTQTVYFQAPEDWANMYNAFAGPDDTEPYMHVCVYWWNGIGSKWPNGSNVMWVGYQAHLIDKANRIYSAKIPNDGYTPSIIWNNGVNSGMDSSRQIFYYGRNIKDSNVEGARPGEYDTLPEGTPFEDNMDGCIQIINYSRSSINVLTGFEEYDSDWYVYYGDGCYGCYPMTSPNYYGKYASCVNPEHNHYYTEPTEPYPYPTEYQTPTESDQPHYGGGIINFDAASAGWENASRILFYIHEVGGDELIAWGSKKLSGTKGDNNIWSFDAASIGVEAGKQYYVIFNNYDTNAETYPLLLDTTCFGDRAYVTGNYIENPIDSNKTSLEARWANSSMGSLLQITSIGNLVGETVPANTTKYQIMVDFLASRRNDGLQNALNFNGKDAQTAIDDIASKLGLTKEDVQQAITDAKTIGHSQTGDRTDWSNQWDASKSSLPGGSVTPTEPPTDSYGYVVGAYYLTGSINGDNSGTANVHKNLRFELGDIDYTLSDVKLRAGDKVNVAYYRGNNVFIVYTDGTVQEISINKSGYYTFYFKPYEFGNPNRAYFTAAFTGEIVSGILGDADGNEEIESVDATFIQRWLAKIDTPYTKAELMRGDVDSSGDLELTDVTAIQYYLAHLKTLFPIGTVIS